MTRREFVLHVARSGGSAYASMVALGLLDARATTPFKPVGPGGGARVIILGAGLAGMCAAYELGKLGYDCWVLEARPRAGGRCWTVRRGTAETELGGEQQVAAFDDGLYFNPGPARIPQHHQATLHYCREFGVGVEVFTNVNDAAYYYHQGTGPLAGRAVRIRAVKADLRGYAAELLAKAVRHDALDTPLSVEDKERMVEFLRREGDLSPDLFYRGSRRRGSLQPSGASGQPGEGEDPFDLGALLRSGFGAHLSAEYGVAQQMTMLQIAGGTDQLAQAFERRLRGRITYEAEVTAIRRAGSGVRIVYRDRDGATRQALGDICVCTIPLSVLRDIPADFSPEMQAAIAAVPYAAAVKVGLQFRRRFWEEDEGIFGGITRTNTSIAQIWYPSTGYLGEKGVLVGAYTFGADATALGNLTPAQRQARALAEGRAIHPQYDQEFETGFSVAWQRLRHSLGGWATYSTAARERHEPVLNRPDGPIYLAGEHLSSLTGWMAGALESAQRVVTAIHERVQALRSQR